MSENTMDKVVEKIDDLSKDLEASRITAEDYQKTKADLAAAAEKANLTHEQHEVLAKDIAEMRKMLETSYGPSGAEDARKMMADTIRAAYFRKRYGAVKDTHNVTKAAADYVTTTDASAGVFVPTILDSDVRKTMQIHGKVWQRVQKVTLAPGKACDFPWENTLATASVRVTQGGGLTQDSGPIAYGKDTLRPVLVNDLVLLAAELLESADVNVGDLFADQMIRAIVRKMEYGIVLGTTAGTAWPSMGLLNNGSTNTQTEMATPTIPLMGTFIGECIADWEGSFDQESNQILLTPAVINVLTNSVVGSSELTGLRIWGDPVNGHQKKLDGYDLVPTPFAISTTNRAIMAPLGDIKVAWSGRIAIDFNPYASGVAAAGDGWASNEVAMKAQTHFDYGLGNPSAIHKAVFTGLS